MSELSLLTSMLVKPTQCTDPEATCGQCWSSWAWGENAAVTPKPGLTDTVFLSFCHSLYVCACLSEWLRSRWALLSNLTRPLSPSLQSYRVDAVLACVRSLRSDKSRPMFDKEQVGGLLCAGKCTGKTATHIPEQCSQSHCVVLYLQRGPCTYPGLAS